MLKQSHAVWTVRCLLALSFFGLALGHWSTDQPYRALLWNQKLCEPLVSLFGLSWQDWANNTQVSVVIDSCAWWLGCLFALFAAAQLIPLKKPLDKILFISSLSALSIIGLGRWADHYFDIIWPLEYTLRFCLPLFCFYLVKTKLIPPSPLILRILLCACAATFIGHGCYALNIFPTPYAFLYMLSALLPTEDTELRILLKIIGSIDILVGLLLCWPSARRPVLLWMGFWGASTALLRLSYIDSYFFMETAGPALAAFLERLPHCFIPLLCWFYLKPQAEQRAETGIEQESVHATPLTT